jgi:medium-chain acyl-[acyl-carrier-protein] hydrolase
MRAKLRLFCLPHAGGGAVSFYSWGALLPAFVQVCSVRLPGRETRLSEPLFTEIDPLVDVMVQELQPWLDIPYAVFGHSMGALLAFEWVRRQQRAGKSMPVWLFLSGRRAPDMPGEMKSLQTLPDREFVAELSRLYNGMPDEIVDDDESIRVFLPILRADIAVVESYRFVMGEPLDCPMTVFAGAKDASVSWDQMLAWKRQAGRSFALHIVQGGHFYSQGPLLRAISATLAKVYP